MLVELLTRAGVIPARRARNDRLRKAIYRSPGNPGPRRPGFSVEWRRESANGRLSVVPKTHMDLWPGFMAVRARPVAQLLAAGARRGGPAAGARFALHWMRRQRQKRSVGKLEMTAENLRLAFAAARSFDHELGADRKAVGQPVGTIRHDTLHTPDPRRDHAIKSATPWHPNVKAD